MRNSNSKSVSTFTIPPLALLELYLAKTSCH